MTRTQVGLSVIGDPATADVPAFAALIEGAARGIAGAGTIHTTLCGGNGAEGGVVVIDGITPAALGEDLTRRRLPGTVATDLRAVDDDIAVLAVRAADAFVARDFAERGLRAALSRSGASSEIQGGKRERQVLIDLQKMMAVDLTIPEIVSAAGGGASLEATVVKSSAPRPTPSLVKAPAPAPAPGEVRVLLSDVADIGLFPVGEPLRRDGAVEVRVTGPQASRKAVVDAVRQLQPPAGIEVALLDDDSVEGVDVIVAAAPGSASGADDLRRALLAIPGVRLGEERPAMRIDVDKERASRLGVSGEHISAVVEVALRGRLLLRNTENVTVRLKGELPPELLMQLVVARTDAGPVRLMDVARVTADRARVDRLDGQPAERVRVLFDVGVRKNALVAVEQAVARSPAKAIVERRDLVRGHCR